MLTASQETAATIARNWQRVQANVLEAVVQAGRQTNDVTIVGVAKYVDADLTAQLVQAGCLNIGENRPQNLWLKADDFEQRQLPVHWHLIGHLQRNKAKRVSPYLACLHSLDSLRLALALIEAAAELGRRLPVLVEVNVTQDNSKTGLQANEVRRLFEEIQHQPNLEIRGLMAMASRDSGGDMARAEFASVRELRDELQQRFPHLKLNQLSMGMSGDYREAILEGATLIRIGSHLFEGIL